MKKNPGRKERRRQAKHNRTALSGVKMWFNEMMMKKRNKILKKTSRRNRSIHADLARGKDQTIIHEIDGTNFVV